MHGIYRTVSSVRKLVFKNRICIGIVGIIPLFYSCTSHSEIYDPKPAFHHLKAELYADDGGKIYHRTIDVSGFPKKSYAYRDYLRMDTVIDGQLTVLDTHLVDLLDVPTFREVAVNDSNARYRLFEDRSFFYFLDEVADGGTLHASRKSH